MPIIGLGLGTSNPGVAVLRGVPPAVVPGGGSGRQQALFLERFEIAVQFDNGLAGKSRAAFAAENLAPHWHGMVFFVAGQAAAVADNFSNPLRRILPIAALGDLRQIGRPLALIVCQRSFAFPVRAVAACAVILEKLWTSYRKRMAARVLRKRRAAKKHRKSRSDHSERGISHLHPLE